MSCWPAHELLLLNAYVQKPTLNINAHIFSRARGLNLGLSLHKYPYFVNASSKGSGETALHICKCAGWPESSLFNNETKICMFFFRNKNSYCYVIWP